MKTKLVEKFEEKLALRPTSETAFYKMFSTWIRSYKDLPFKTYQRANVFRYETKATRPFLRSREFHWIEAHCAFATEQEALQQVKEDMETTKEVLHNIFCIPFIFFKRPSWDKFAGAESTYAADVLNPDGKIIQQPSTHFLGINFSKPFNIKFKDKDGKEAANTLADEIVREGLKRGVIFDLSMPFMRFLNFQRNVVKIKPPLTISEDQADKAVDVFEESLNAALKALRVL